MSFFGGPAKPVQTYTPEPEEPAVERAELPSPRANTLITKATASSRWRAPLRVKWFWTAQSSWPPPA